MMGKADVGSRRRHELRARKQRILAGSRRPGPSRRELSSASANCSGRGMAAVGCE